MSVAGAPWYSWPVRWGRDALQFAGRGERDSLDAGRYVISNPSEFGRLLDDAIQVAGGAALAEAGAGGFGAGVGLDLTGFGLPAGIALGAASALGLVTGAALAAHGFADGIGDLANVYSMSIDGGKPSEIPSDPPDGWLEGRSNIVVRAPGSNVDITDVDRVSGGVLWELKSAAAAPDSSIWIKEQMFDKFDRFIEARRLLPGYQDAPIGFDFTGSDIYPPFRQAVESAVKALRSGFPDVTVYLRWAG